MSGRLLKLYWTVSASVGMRYNTLAYLKECHRASRERRQLALLPIEQLKDIGISEAQRDKEVRRGYLLRIDEFHQRRYIKGARWM